MKLNPFLFLLALACLCLVGMASPAEASHCGKGRVSKLVHRLLHPFAHHRNRGL